MDSTALTAGEGRLANVTVTLAGGRTFDLGRPGTARHERRLRRYIRLRMRTDPAFREAYAGTYDLKGRVK